MADLSLDLNKGSSTYGDLLLLNGDLVLTSDANPNGTNPVLQNIVQRLRWFQGEWFLNVNGGVPYLQTIFIKGQSLSKIEAIFFSVISNTPGVVVITSFSVSFNSLTRLLTISFQCQTTSGPIDYSGTLETQ